MNKPLLECRNLTCGYPDHQVLSEIDLQILPGERVVLLGPNGSGKSTLLKSISKAVQPILGEVLLRGESLQSLSYREVAQRVAFVPQEESFKFEFRVKDVVAMGRMPLSNSLWDSEADSIAAENAMQQADCYHLRDRSVTELSGGEKQRVLIARALAQGAPLVLLDEPTSHLDVEHQLSVAHLVSQLAHEGKSTVTAIHDLNLASSLADRAILLQNGKIGLDAPIRSVLESSFLDDVYRVRFERIRLDNDRLIVVPTKL